MITRDDVLKVSLLARLQLDEQQLDLMADQLARIVQYVDQLAEVDTTGVEPMAHPFELTNVFRDDQLRPSLPREQAVGGAPRTDGECFLVPAVLGE